MEVLCHKFNILILSHFSSSFAFSRPPYKKIIDFHFAFSFRVLLSVFLCLGYGTLENPFHLVFYVIIGILFEFIMISAECRPSSSVVLILRWRLAIRQNLDDERWLKGFLSNFSFWNV